MLSSQLLHRHHNHLLPLPPLPPLPVLLPLRFGFILFVFSSHHHHPHLCYWVRPSFRCFRLSVSSSSCRSIVAQRTGGQQSSGHRHSPPEFLLPGYEDDEDEDEESQEREKDEERKGVEASHQADIVRKNTERINGEQIDVFQEWSWDWVLSSRLLFSLHFLFFLGEFLSKVNDALSFMDRDVVSAIHRAFDMKGIANTANKTEGGGATSSSSSSTSTTSTFTIPTPGATKGGSKDQTDQTGGRGGSGATTSRTATPSPEQSQSQPRKPQHQQQDSRFTLLDLSDGMKPSGSMMIMMMTMEEQEVEQVVVLFLATSTWTTAISSPGALLLLGQSWSSDGHSVCGCDEGQSKEEKEETKQKCSYDIDWFVLCFRCFCCLFVFLLFFSFLALSFFSLSFPDSYIWACSFPHVRPSGCCSHSLSSSSSLLVTPCLSFFFTPYFFCASSPSLIASATLFFSSSSSSSFAPPQPTFMELFLQSKVRDIPALVHSFTVSLFHSHTYFFVALECQVNVLRKLFSAKC